VSDPFPSVATVLDQYLGLIERMEDLAAEAEAGGDHPTAARIRAAMEPDQECA
jgi:hypothetical protein